MIIFPFLLSFWLLLLALVLLSISIIFVFFLSNSYSLSNTFFLFKRILIHFWQFWCSCVRTLSFFISFSNTRISLCKDLYLSFRIFSLFISFISYNCLYFSFCFISLFIFFFSIFISSSFEFIKIFNFFCFFSILFGFTLKILTNFSLESTSFFISFNSLNNSKFCFFNSIISFFCSDIFLLHLLSSFKHNLFSFRICILISSTFCFNSKRFIFGTALLDLIFVLYLILFLLNLIEFFFVINLLVFLVSGIPKIFPSNFDIDIFGSLIWNWMSKLWVIGLVINSIFFSKVSFWLSSEIYIQFLFIIFIIII